MSLTTPPSVQKLQTALHDKAKGSPNFRFYALYDKVYRPDVLIFAYDCCQANAGAPGVDGQTFEGIEEYGVAKWLDELAQELRSRTYRPQPVRRVWIPKPDGKQRPLGVPAIKDRQSDDARQRVRAAEGADIGGYPGGGNPGGGYPGGGYPGGYPGGNPRRGPWGGSPYPGGGGGGPYGGRQNIEENPKMQSLMRPGYSLTVDLKNPEIDITDNQYRKLLLYTDGRQLPKNNDDRHEEVAAHWDGSRLVSDERSPLGGKMNRAFELSQNGRQLFETLHIDYGRSSTPLTIRYVYDAVTNEEIRNSADSDPNRPQLKRHSDDSGTTSGTQSSGDSDPNRPVLKKHSDDGGSPSQ